MRFAAGVGGFALSAMLYAIPTGGTWAGDAAPEIGTAVLIKNEVVATLGDNKRDLREGVRVHRTEYLQTGDSAQAELKLDDQTKLALGPNAGLKLDEFVIGKSGGVTTIGVNFVKGTFRFITGAQKKDAYVIETPSATIGVRGTVFDVYVDGSGDTLVLASPGRGQHLQQDEEAAGATTRSDASFTQTPPVSFPLRSSSPRS